MKKIAVTLLLLSAAPVLYSTEPPGISTASAPAETHSPATGTPQPFSDTGTEQDKELLEGIQRAIQDATDISPQAKSVSILVSSGAVVLEGRVNDAREKKALDSLARSVPGVKKLKNKVQVKPDAKPDVKK